MNFADPPPDVFVIDICLILYITNRTTKLVHL